VISKISKTINEGIFHISNPQLIYNGIDSHIFSNNEKNSKIENSIFYFGNLSKEKGVETALEAFNRIKKDVPNCTLHFVGKTNDYQSKLIDFLPKDVLKDVFFYGNQSFSEIVNLLSKAAVVFFPSKGENFSLALLESLSLSKIVICSDIPAFSEIVKHGENGFIAKDIEDFHAITLKIFQSSTEQISTIENNARNTVVENFDISKMTDNTIQYYQTIISEII
jgi:glycosyltransferase involved in cell wall biosynthesis